MKRTPEAVGDGAVILKTAGTIRRFLDAVAELAGLPAWSAGSHTFHGGEWLEALVLTECSGRPNLRRYEPHQDRASESADGDRPDFDDGTTEDDASWGPMQVMGYNVKGLLGLRRNAEMRYSLLFDWVVGVGFGLEVLRRELRASNGEVPVALARYNGGSWKNPRNDGSLRNQHYVDKVARNAAVVRADRAAGERSERERETR